MSILVNNLTKLYGAQKAVDNISFEIHPGEIVGFLGPNGAGKSTTMKMLTTYITPTSGTASVAGFDIYKHTMDIKKAVGYLPESNPLYYDMYVREYLTFAAKIHQIENVKSSVDDVIEMTGLNKEIKKKIGTLSKGYKQRVGIAQAIIHNPQVLILDEPTSGLDPNQIEEIRKLILNIGKEKSVMLSTHIMQEVEAMCSSVIIINDGKIVKTTQLEHNTVPKEVANNTLQVVFNSAIENDTLSLFLSNIDHQIQPTSATEILISTSEMQQVKKRLMEFALEKNIDIVSFKEHTTSLEDIFKQVTQK